MKIETIWENEVDLVSALKEQSKAHPNLYFYPISHGFGGAKIWSGEKLNNEAPSDCMVLKGFNRHYYKNGKRKTFTKNQIIKDQQTKSR